MLLQLAYRIDLRDVHALVVNVHHENETNLAADQPPLGGFSLLIGGFPSQADGGNPVVVEITVHNLRMFDGYAGAQALHLVDVDHVFQERGHQQSSATVGHGAAEGVEVKKLIFVVAAGALFQGVQIHRVGDAKILEWKQQFVVNGLGQPDFHSNPVVETKQHTLAIHTLWGGGHAQEDLRLVVGQELLIDRLRFVMKLIHHSVVVKIRGGLSSEILRVEGLNRQK